MQKRATAAAAVMLGGLVAIACGGSPSAPSAVESPAPASHETDARSPPASRLEAETILAFGDSLTEGYVSLAPGILLAVQPGKSYPAQLEALLLARFPTQGVRVANRGRGGETADKGRKRFLGEFTSVQPDVVLILEGTNDLSLAFFKAELDGTDFDTGVFGRIAEDVRWMARTAQVRGAFVFVATLPPVGDVREAKNPGTRTAVRSTNGRLRTMAGGIGAGVVDVHAALSGGTGLIGGDGLHPTVAGYERIARAFFDEITRRFETTVGTSTLTGRPALEGGKAVP